MAKKDYRIKYDPELHENHGKKFTKEDLMYMCSMWDSMKKADIALALGKTHATILSKANYLRKIGLFEHYKKLGKAEIN